MANLESGCYNLAFGFTICWELDISIKRVAIELKLLGNSLDKWILDATHTCIHIGVDVGLGGTSLDLCVNWDKKKVTLKGEVHWLGQHKEFDVILFKW